MVIDNDSCRVIMITVCKYMCSIVLYTTLVCFPLPSVFHYMYSLYGENNLIHDDWIAYNVVQ